LRLIENISHALAPPAVEVSNAPGSVEVVLRSQDNGRRTLIHLVNFTGEMTRPIREVLPLRDVHLTLAKGTVISKAYTLRTARPLTVATLPDGRRQITVPKLDEYEVVVMEK
jgi:hypothetical protein